jgi:O-antigen/teichoic acid export membrane protein
MNQSRAIFKNTVAQTLANLINKFGNLIVVFLIARMLHAAGVGIYSTAVAYYVVIDEATNMGASTYLIREIAKEPRLTSRYVVNFCIMGTILALLGLAGFWLILPHLGYSTDMTLSMYVIVLAIIPGTFNAVQNSVFIAHQRVEFITITTFISSLLGIAGSIYLLLNHYSIVYLVILFVIVQYLTAFLNNYFINKQITPLKWQFEPKFALQMLWDIKTFAMLSIIGAMLANPEIIMLSFIVSEDDIGYYSAAIKVAYFWLFISQIFMNNVYPVLSRSFYKEDKQFQAIQDKSIKYLLALSLPIAVGLIVVAGPTIALLYGPGFEKAILPLQILSAGLPIGFASAVLWRALAARGKQATVLITRIVSLVTRLVGGWLLITFVSTIGAAISATLNLILGMLLLAYFLKNEGIPINFARNGWKFTLTAGGMGLIIWFMGAETSLWLLIPTAVIVYGILILLVRAFSQEDYAVFQSIWRPGLAAKQAGIPDKGDNGSDLPL